MGLSQTPLRAMKLRSSYCTDTPMLGFCVGKRRVVVANQSTNCCDKNSKFVGDLTQTNLHPPLPGLSFYSHKPLWLVLFSGKYIYITNLRPAMFYSNPFKYKWLHTHLCFFFLLYRQEKIRTLCKLGYFVTNMSSVLVSK